MSTDITIHSTPNNSNNRKRPRKPLVHLLATDGYGDVASITFHPDDAPALAKAILNAGKSAASGHGRKPVTIELRAHGS